MNYLKFPRLLFENERYGELSVSEKVLYALMLDRASLSEKNGWIDERGMVYIVFTRREAARILGISEKCAGRLFSKLKERGLIIKCGKRGKADIFYVKNVHCYTDKSSDDIRTKVPLSKTEINKNKKSHSSYEQAKKKEDDSLLKQILENCELEIWNDGTGEVMENAIRKMYSAESIKVCGRTVLRDEILKSLLKQTGDSIIFAHDVIKNTKAPIQAPSEYLISVLFNAPYDYEAFETICQPI